MKLSHSFAILFLSALGVMGQTTPYMVQLLQKPNAASAKAWLQINSSPTFLAGTGISFTTDSQGRTIISATSTGGTVTTVSSGDLSPLFTTSVANPSTTPALSFSQVGQNQNLFFASPNGAPGNPIFRSVLTSDLPYVPVQNLDDAEALDVSLINSKTAPTPLIKELKAGANVTLTDNGTSVTVASTGGGSPSQSTIGSAMIDESNYLMTLRWMPADIADGSSSFGYSGYGDAFSFGGTGSVHSKQNMNSAFTLGAFAEIYATTLNTAVYSSSATANAVQPYHNGGFYFQMYLHVRNTNNVRICAGFASSLGVLTSDSAITNCAYFRYSTFSNDATWHGVVCNATNQQVVDTGASLATDTDYYLQMFKTNGTTNVCFVVNRGSPVTTTSFAPDRVSQLSDCMEAFLGITPLESANKTNWFRYIGYTVDWVKK